MSYSTEFGTLIKTKIEINSDYIVCDNKKIYCKDVTFVNYTWGTESVKFLWSIDRMIYIKSKDDKLVINCTSKFDSEQICNERAEKIIKCADKYIVTRLYNEMLEKINQGEVVPFWDGFIDKNGIILVDKRLYRNTGKQHFKWNEFEVIQNGNSIILCPIADDRLGMSESVGGFNNFPVLYELLKEKRVKGCILY